MITDQHLLDLCAAIARDRALDAEWVRNLSDQIDAFRTRTVHKLSRVDTLEQLLNSDAVCATGQAKWVPIRAALDDAGFREWFAQTVCSADPDDSDPDTWIELYDTCLKEMREYCVGRQGKPLSPMLKLSRALCALFPTRFSAIGSEGGPQGLKRAYQQIIGGRGGHRVILNQRIARRLELALGAVDPDDTIALARRLILPMQILKAVSDQAQPIQPGAV